MVARAERLPLRDASLDGVVATSLLGCLQDPGRLFAEFRRVLRPGGHAVITFTNRSSLLLRLNYRLPKGWRPPETDAPDAAPFRLYRVEEARAGLRDLGFEVLSVTCYNHVLQAGHNLLPPRRLALLLDRLARGAARSRWARNFLIVARKRAAD